MLSKLKTLFSNCPGFQKFKNEIWRYVLCVENKHYGHIIIVVSVHHLLGGKIQIVRHSIKVVYMQTLIDCRVSRISPSPLPKLKWVPSQVVWRQSVLLPRQSVLLF